MPVFALFHAKKAYRLRYIGMLFLYFTVRMKFVKILTTTIVNNLTNFTNNLTNLIKCMEFCIGEIKADLK